MNALRNHFWRSLFFIGGLWICSTAIVISVKADFGVPSWDVLHIGLTNYTPLTAGTWNIILGILIVLSTCLYSRRLPKWGTLLNMILIGVFFDLITFLDFIPDPPNLAMKGVWFLFSIVLLALGNTMYIVAQYGAGPRDGLMLILTERTGASIRKVRTYIEISAVVLGALLGGPVHIGTILFSFTIGPIIQFFLPRCEKVLDSLLVAKEKQPSAPRTKIA
ncbi:YczE/YyaS/YitT family protein [Risungbinella massiliensis]|uniref:YczE/YyaS/YitT family protein n=1 Tax=Risungbinella massiliensis TaxID=1329796 RepID=UPI0005CC3EC2|nr:membrane protein [Risungbinella massiliensis]